MTDESLLGDAEKRMKGQGWTRKQLPQVVERAFTTQVAPALERLKTDFRERRVPQKFFKLADECERYIAREVGLIVRSEQVCFVGMKTNTLEEKEEVMSQWMAGDIGENTRIAIGILLSGFGGNFVLRYESPSETWRCGMGYLYVGYGGPQPRIVGNHTVLKRGNGEDIFNEFVEGVLFYLQGGHYKKGYGSRFSIEEITTDPYLFT